MEERSSGNRLSWNRNWLYVNLLKRSNRWIVRFEAKPSFRARCSTLHPCDSTVSNQFQLMVVVNLKELPGGRSSAKGWRRPPGLLPPKSAQAVHCMDDAYWMLIWS